MFPNSSVPSKETKYLKDDPTKVNINAIIIMYHIRIVLHTLIIVLGITGNAMVIWVAGFKLKRKVTNVWLVNLAVADLMFCITLVFSLLNIVLYNHWHFGVFLCKFNGFFKYANMFCSVFLLAVISLDRMLCVWRPVFTKRHRTLCAARVVAVLVWITAIIFSSPYSYLQVYKKKKNNNNYSKCSLDVKEGKNGAKYALYFIRFLCGFVLPFGVILVCHIVAGLSLRRTRLSGKSRPLRILASLVIAFFLCWAPYHCLLLVKMVDRRNDVLKICISLATCLAYFNSCVNPLLYFFMGLNVRGHLRQSLMGIYRRALANVEGQTSQSNDYSLEESTASKYSSAVVAGRTMRNNVGSQ